MPSIPIYVVLAAHAAIALGTLAGGWRIVHTMGSKITKLRPDGFCVETAGAVTLFGATMSGIPVLTTRTQSPAQLPGVGSTTRLSAVKWRVDYSDSLGLGLYDPGSSDIRGDIIFVNRIDSHNRHAADLAASIRL